MTPIAQLPFAVRTIPPNSWCWPFIDDIRRVLLLGVQKLTPDVDGREATAQGDVASSSFCGDLIKLQTPTLFLSVGSMTMGQTGTRHLSVRWFCEANSNDRVLCDLCRTGGGECGELPKLLRRVRWIGVYAGFSRVAFVPRTLWVD